jgi:hypothetical protein
MRRKVTIPALNEFMKELAAAARSAGAVYFTGGTTALLLGFREQTIDIDLKLDPEPAGVFEAIAELKNRLDLNVELASPADFIPAPDDWRDRSQPIASIGCVEFFHYDFSLQALAKIERGHAQDLRDVVNLVHNGYVSLDELKSRFAQIEAGLLRYPAIDAEQFRQKVDQFVTEQQAHEP